MSDLPLLFSDVARWYAASTVALGIRTGLTDALLAGGGSSGELAATAGVDGENAARWADAMVAGGYATVTDGQYAPVEDTLGILRGGGILDVRAIVELLVPLGALLPRVQTAIRDGGGVRSAEFQDALGMTAERVNVPMYDELLLSEWIAGHPDLHAALERGVDAAEVGPGGGTCPPDTCPAVSRLQVRRLRHRYRDRYGGERERDCGGPGQPRFEAVDAVELPEGAFDVVCMFDAFHHMTDPDGVLDGIRASLRPGGSLLLAEGRCPAMRRRTLLTRPQCWSTVRTSSTASRKARSRASPGSGLPGRDGGSVPCSRGTGSPRLGGWSRRPVTS